ncbi:MAG: CHAD domain-containing protein [Planctomycetes bacterium]|nr:CHAD domain-containing protein [Planctomycetota bacterium]
MPHDVETEFRFRGAPDLEVAAIDGALATAGYRDAAAADHRFVDTYLDDGEGSLQQAGLGLRLRASGSGQELACKARRETEGGRCVRDEWTASWPTTLAPRTAAELPDELRDLVEPFVLDRPLLATLRLSIRRDSRVLPGEDGALGELAIDRVEAEAAGRKAAFLEVELEVLEDLPGCERLAARLAGLLPLQPAQDDKPSHAGALLGLQRPPLPAATLAMTMPIGAALAAIAAPHLQALQQAEVGVRQDRDPGHLHAMRVAIRRLRELVRSCRDLWPAADSRWLLDVLGEAGRRLGALRDLDVLLADLPAGIAKLPPGLLPAGKALLDWVRDRRQEAKQLALGWLRAATRLADQRRLHAMLVAGPAGSAAAEPLATALAPRLRRASRRVAKLAQAIPDDLPLAPLHELRIRCKRLRYLAEAFADLPGLECGKSLAAVTGLQQALGEVCDHETAASTLLGWVPGAAATLAEGLQVAAALGALATGASTAAGKARKRARRQLARVDRPKVYRRFEAGLAPDANLAP